MVAICAPDNIDGFLARTIYASVLELYDAWFSAIRSRRIWAGILLQLRGQPRSSLTGSPTVFAALKRAIVDAQPSLETENRKQIAEAIAPAKLSQCSVRAGAGLPAPMHTDSAHADRRQASTSIRSPSSLRGLDAHR